MLLDGGYWLHAIFSRYSLGVIFIHIASISREMCRLKPALNRATGSSVFSSSISHAVTCFVPAMIRISWPSDRLIEPARIEATRPRAVEQAGRQSQIA